MMSALRRNVGRADERTAKAAKSASATSVVAKEVEFFSELHRSWWDASGGPMRPLHTLNAVRVPLICESVLRPSGPEGRPLDNLRILDVGCGGGILTEALAKCGGQVTGVDASEELIKVASRHAQLDASIKDRVHYVAATIEDYSIENGASFDVVVLSEVIEHVANPDLFLRHCCDLLRPGGSIIVTTINRTISSFLVAIVYLEYITGAFAKGTHEWIKFISPETVTKSLRNYGCEVRRVQGTRHLAATQTWALRADTSVFYFLHAVKTPKQLDR